MYVSAIEDVAAMKLAEAMEEEKKNEGKVQRSNSLVSGDLILDREDRYGFDDAVFDTGLNVDTPHWVWITAGSCKMDQGPPKSWLMDTAVGSSESSLAGESWRVNILQV